MELIGLLKKDLEISQLYEQSVRPQLLDSIFSRFRLADRQLFKDIEEQFKKLSIKHRTQTEHQSIRKQLRLPSINKVPQESEEEIQRKVLEEIIANANKNIDKQPIKQQVKETKPLRNTKPRYKHLYTYTPGLSKMQKYYGFESVDVPTESYGKSGVYNLVNIYKSQNIDVKYLEDAQPKAIRNKLSSRNLEQKIANMNTFVRSPDFKNTIRLLGEQSNFFLTKINHIDKLNRKSIKEKTLAKIELTEVSNKTMVFQELIYIQINNYKLEQNKQLELFKLEHLPSWGRLSSVIQSIISYVKRYKMKSVTLRGSLLLNIDGSNKKPHDSDIVNCFVNREMIPDIKKDRRRLDFRRDKSKAATAIQRMWRGVVVIKRQKQKLKKQQQIFQKFYSALLYKKFKKTLKQKYEQKFRWCLAAQQMLDQRWHDYRQDAIEIHIPSFSMQQWTRLTTHHMASFENQISRIWRTHTKRVILVLPSADAKLLTFLLKNIPVAKPQLHILVPDNTHIFPSYISLASLLYYSHTTLMKIKDLVKNQSCYIVPGMMSDLKQEVLISEYLRIPLYCPRISLIKSISVASCKQLIDQLQLSTLPYEKIEKSSNIQTVCAHFLRLIMYNPQFSSWLMKMDRQFAGRGIASLNLNEDRQFCRLFKKADRTGDEIEKMHELLVRMVQQKLQPAEQLYRKDEFLAKFLEVGGIIEAQCKPGCKTFQICLEIEVRQVKVNGVLRCIPMSPFCNMAFLKEQCHMAEQIKHISESLIDKGFRGFCSLTYLQSDNTHYVVDIKPYLTVAASSLFFDSSIRYLYVPHVSHANIMNCDPEELIISTRKVKDNEQGTLITLSKHYSLLVIGKDTHDLKRTSVDMLRYIQYRGASTQSGEKEYTRSDCYSISEIASAIKSV